MKSLFRNKKGNTLMMMAMFMLGSILMVTMSASEVIRSNLIMSKMQKDATKSYYTAESGLELVLLNVRQRDFDVRTCSSGDYVSFSDAACGGVAPCCLNTEISHSLGGQNSYKLLFEKEGSDVVFTSFGTIYESRRVVEVRYCLVDCEGKSCGDDNGCGGTCPPSCTTDPNCRPTGSVLNATEVAGGGCCAGDTCYECNDGYAWNGAICEFICEPDCEGKSCGENDGCGNPCPATCNSLPGCRFAALPNTKAGDGECCGVDSCYACEDEYYWNEVSGACEYLGIIAFNGATGRTCDEICTQDYVNRECVSVGTDEKAMNSMGNKYAVINNREECSSVVSDCSTVFSVSPFPFRPFTCEEKQTNWTNCRCYKCDDDEGDPCETNECMENGTIACDGSCEGETFKALGEICSTGACDGAGTCTGCHADYTKECYSDTCIAPNTAVCGDTCVSPGTINCGGQCVGTSTRMYGFDCDAGKECNGEGLCVPIIPMIVELNKISGKSCSQFCADKYLNRTCRSIGTDAGATNSRYLSYVFGAKTASSCLSYNGSCASVMNDEFGAAANCSGIDTKWTNCLCSRCVANIGAFCWTDSICNSQFGSVGCDGSCVSNNYYDEGDSCIEGGKPGECDGEGNCDLCDAGFGDPCNNADCQVPGTITCFDGCSTSALRPAGFSCAGGTGECNSSGSCIICQPGYKDSCNDGPCEVAGTKKCNGVDCTSVALKVAGTDCDSDNNTTLDGECNATGTCVSCSPQEGNPCNTGPCEVAGVLLCNGLTCSSLAKKAVGTECDSDNNTTLDGECDASGVCKKCEVTKGNPCNNGPCEIPGVLGCDGLACSSNAIEAVGTACDSDNNTTLDGECDASGVCVHCDSKNGQACGGTACQGDGTWNCAGDCSGVFVEKGMGCGVGLECDGAGNCVGAFGDMIILNEMSNKTCDERCSALNSRTCTDVGTDAAATNNKYGAYNWISGCRELNGNCGSKMVAGGAFCLGHRSYWTNCYCAACHEDYGEPCNTGNDCLIPGVVRCDGTCTRGATDYRPSGYSCNGGADECNAVGVCLDCLDGVYNTECGAEACKNPGLWNCDGDVCVGITNKEVGTNCGVDLECNATGVCVAPLPEIVTLNSASGKSCNQICADNYTNRRCKSIGMASSGTGWSYAFNSSAVTSGTCATVMDNNGYVYNGIPTKWTRCLCEKCDEDYGDSCNTGECHVAGTVLCNGDCSTGTQIDSEGTLCNGGVDECDASGNCVVCDHDKFNQACNNDQCEVAGVWDCSGLVCSSSAVKPLGDSCVFEGGAGRCNGSGSCIACDGNYTNSCNDGQCEVPGTYDCMGVCSSSADRPDGYWCDGGLGPESGKCDGSGNCIACDPLKDNVCYDLPGFTGDPRCISPGITQCDGSCLGASQKPEPASCDTQMECNASGDCIIAPLERVMLNLHTGRSCDDICMNDANGRNCLSVGVNSSGNSHDAWYYTIWEGVDTCVTGAADCTSVFNRSPESSDFTCSGKQTNWTNCLCSH